MPLHTVKKPFSWFPDGFTVEDLVAGVERDFGVLAEGLERAGLIVLSAIEGKPVVDPDDPKPAPKPKLEPTPTPAPDPAPAPTPTPDPAPAPSVDLAAAVKELASKKK